MQDEHISAGEWTRWLESDREWKGQVLGHLIDHGERLARLEVKDDAGRAEQAAATTKWWAVVGTLVTAIVNGVLIALGAKTG